MIAPHSTNRAIQVALLVWASFQISAPSPPPPGNSQGFAISREVDFVVLPVIVRNREGQFVSGLEASNFHVYENGRQQAVTLFRSEDTPVALGLVVDRSGSMAAKANEVIQGALAFVEASNPQDQEFVVNFAEKPVLGLTVSEPFTTNTGDLRAALSTNLAGGRTALYDAVVAALQHLDLINAGKKVLILISDGGDNASQNNFTQALRMAQSANVVIYTIGLYDEHSADQNPKVLSQFARETGGVAYSPSTSGEVVRVCRQIAGDVRHQYTVGYAPAEEGRNTYRKIRVEVASSLHGKLSVRTRAGYLPPSSKQSDSPVQEGANR